MNKKMIQQAQQMQARLKSMQDEIAQTIIESSAGGGVIKGKILLGIPLGCSPIKPDSWAPIGLKYLNEVILQHLDED